MTTMDITPPPAVDVAAGPATSGQGRLDTDRRSWQGRLHLMVLTAVIGMLVLVGCGKASTATPVAPAAAAAGAGAAGSAMAMPSTTAGGCPTSNTTTFAKTKFVLHVGLAAGTFHRYLYKPFKAGSFHKGATGRITALIKAGATALFDEHEIRLAIADVKASPALCKVLIAPLAEVADKFAALKSKVTGGDTTGLEPVNSNLSSISSTSAAGGAPITESTNQATG